MSISLELPSRQPRRQDDQGFSVREARDIVQDLFEPSAAIYWTDFLLSIGFGWLCFNRFRWSSSIAVQVLAYVGAVLLFYRAGSFTHELVHLRSGTFRAFHVAWNMFCGIPLLMPSFMYTTHIAHHAKNHYATQDDGEYLPLSHGSLRGLVFYLLQIFVIPLLAVARFLIVTPLSWLSPRFRRWVQGHASSLVMDPSFVRPLPSNKELRAWRLQETCCFLVLSGVAASVVTGKVEITWIVKIYLIAVGVMLLNELRTLGAHRFAFDGKHQVTFVEQLLDSVNFPDRPWLGELWAPVGLRFHALHHLFPSMPYHNLAKAHKRLMERLPADSPYRQTVSHSLWSTLGELVGRIRANQRSQ